MKNLYAFLLVAFVAFTTNAQLITPLSESFKYNLTSSICADFDGDGILDGDVDTNDDGQIQISEALAVKGISTPNNGVNSLVGIRSFTNLKALDCSGCNLVYLDLTGLANLETLNCSYMLSLSSLNITGLTNLKTLNCSGSRITSLDVSAFTSLESLSCSGSYQGGLITSLIINGANNLKNIDCSYNKLTSLNVANMPNLTSLNCAGQQGATVLSLQMTALPNLLSLDSSSNRLSSLNVNDFPSLTSLICWSNQITSLDLSALNNLTKLNCGANALTNLNVSNLNLLEELSVNSNNISALNIANLPLLKTFNCSNNNLSQLDVSNQSNLKYFSCESNHITALNVLNLSNIEELKCSNNELTTLDVSNLSALKQFSCNDNHLTALTLTNASSLWILDCSNNNLTTLNIANFPNLANFNCNSNALTALDFTNMPKLRVFKGRNNPFTTLDFSVLQTEIPQPLPHGYGMRYDLIGCNQLVYLNIKNGLQLARQNSMHDIVFSIEGCDSLAYICVNEQYSGWYLGPTISVNSYCSFIPGGAYNTIIGKLTYDFNSNGCDAADTFSLNGKIRIDDGTETGAAFANATGDYHFYTQAGDFTLTPDFENPYFTISPASATLSFADNNSNTQTQNFCVTPNGTHNDVEITIIPMESPRPGFNVTYQLIYKNKGNQLLSGNVDFTFDDAVLDFVNAYPALNTQSLNTLNWAYTDLLPFESRTVNFTLNVNSPMETPAVNIGDILSFNATINPISGDETMADNTFSLSQTVIGSYDPNDKTCLEGDTLTPEMVGHYLHYLIRFQNKGTAPAQNVVIMDLIDTAKFDMGSLQLTSTSHPQVTKITNNKVEFQFQNINLPAEMDDESGSHGYVAFKIKTKTNLVIGDSVENKADIYFDYNFPVVTNTATTTVAPLLGLDAIVNTSVAIAPNPTKSIVHISSKGNISSVQLFDLQGRIIETMTANDAQVDFDLSQKAKGVYFVKIYTEKGVKVTKVIKE